MKKKIVLIMLIILVIIMSLFLTPKLRSVMLINRIWGISINNYSVVEIDNSLEKFEYEGYLKVVLELDEDEVADFYKKIDFPINGIGGEPEDIRRQDLWTGVEREEIEKIMYTGWDFTGMQRTILFVPKQLTGKLYVTCLKPVDGKCKMFLMYWE